MTNNTSTYGSDELKKGTWPKLYSPHPELQPQCSGITPDRSKRKIIVGKADQDSSMCEGHEGAGKTTELLHTRKE